MNPQNDDLKNRNKRQSSSTVFRYNRKPKKCPVCSSTTIAKYLYGMPAFSEKLEKELEDGKTVLGGCIISEDDPVWVCFNCKTDFYKELV